MSRICSTKGSWRQACLGEPSDGMSGSVSWLVTPVAVHRLDSRPAFDHVRGSSCLRDKIDLTHVDGWHTAGDMIDCFNPVMGLLL